jgi:PQQ-like domain
MSLPARRFAVLVLVALLCSCASLAAGSGARQRAFSPAPDPLGRGAGIPRGAELTDWPEFGLNAQRGDATSRPTGITAANFGALRMQRVSLPGTVDSSPIYLHGVSVGGATHNVILVTTTYGRTIAIDAESGRLLWTFTPPGYAGWAGGPQITNASPIADPDRRFVYAASPNGLIHKLSLSTGKEDRAGAWPVSVTHDATREKLGAALNIDGPYVIAASGGYIGDAPVYQGHVALISRAGGRLRAVFNTLCANRHRLIVPRTCPQSDSAILSRGGVVVEPGRRRLLLSTGNGDWNGRTDFGDSVLELSFPRLRLRQAFTPTDQERLDTEDIDLGSSAPALLGRDRVLIAGKDGIMRVLDLHRLDGNPSSPHEALGGEVQALRTPGGGELFTAPAVWRHGSRTTVFVADGAGTASYALRGGRLRRRWSNSTPGTSPIVAGGLLYVYEPDEGGIEVYDPGSARPLGELAGSPGHWNSPIVVDGHVVEPLGDANEHELSGALQLFSIR